MIETSKLGSNIHLFTFKDQYYMCSTMMRLSEFHESEFKDMRGRFFTHEEYMDRYYDSHKKDKKYSDGKFRYFEEWAGFNIRGDVIRDFYQKFNDSVLSEKEKTFKMILDGVVPKWRQQGYTFFIIAVAAEYTPKWDTRIVTKADDVIPHELAHAYWHTDSEYRDQMTWLIEQSDEKYKEMLYGKLVEMGYAEDLGEILDDEFQAYMSTTTKKEMKAYFKDEDFKIDQEMVDYFNEYTIQLIGE